ncbi:MAG: EAL domain-containing protein, partial [Aquihabitans sp.]
TLVVQVADHTVLHQAQVELSATERRVSALLASVTETVTVLSPEGELLFSTGEVDTAADQANESVGFPFSTIHPDDLERVLEGWEETVANPGRLVNVETRVLHVDGTWGEVFVTGLNLVDNPDVGGIVVTNRDVSSLRRAERLASSQASVLEMIAKGEDLPEILRACGTLVERNGGGGATNIHLLHHNPHETPDAFGGQGQPLEPPYGWSQPILAVGSGNPIGTLSALYTVAHPPTATERQAYDLACSLVAIAVDRVGNEARLAHLALHDSLTGLPNRTLLLDRLDHALARHERSGLHSIAVLFCDLDRFKVVNDSLGHGAGDELLTAFAKRLEATVASGNTVARFGGDEFVVLLEDLQSDEQAVQVGQQIAAALEQPFVLGASQEVFLTVSIGLTMHSEHESGDDWLRDADAAMYRAKDRGRNRLELFDVKMRDAALERLQIENDLRRAVDRDELVLHHQPVVDLRTGRICGVEALVRWNHPTRGLLGPGQFIPVAEDTGLIEELGMHILDLALSDAGRLARKCPSPQFRMGVNVSVRQLNRPELDKVIADLCTSHSWPPHDLVLEITETALSLDTDGLPELLSRIQALGVLLAIDDFGTGYSSLARLGQMPVDQVKIDQAFVAAIDQPDNRLDRIVDAVVAIADALEIEVLGEGVETVAQLDHLRRIHCDLAQGYLFSKPLPLDEVESFLASDPRW